MKKDMLGLSCDKLCNSQPYKKKKSDLNFREGSSIMSVFYPRPLLPFSKGKIENLEYSRYQLLQIFIFIKNWSGQNFQFDLLQIFSFQNQN